MFAHVAVRKMIRLMSLLEGIVEWDRKPARRGTLGPFPKNVGRQEVLKLNEI
jgi:hypothetical protein